jgi:macrodomain Ter protein organizer (MatP/YcbG family)
MDIELIKELSNLGGLFIALIGAGWYVRYISDAHREERKILYDKDSVNDEALRQLMSSSHNQLIQIMTGVNTTLKEMTVAISELKQTIEHGERR